jgi:hypothetical protein
MRRFRAGLQMRLIRRDHAVMRAEVAGGEASLPIFLVEGEPFPPADAAGFFLAEASAAELAWSSAGAGTRSFKRSSHEGP